MRHRSRLAGLPWVLLAPDAWAAPWPEVAQLRFEGNRVTREETLRREIALAEGDAADPAAIEAGRQAILDLELFREADARTEARADGRVDVVYRVHEKRYVLPVPRVNTSSDADLSYGAQLRWSNVWGLGHRLDAVFERGDFPEDRRRREEQSASFTYEAPFLVADRYDLRLSAGRLERVTPRAGGEFDETFRRFEALVADDRRTGRPRNGWLFGTGVLLQDQQAFGDLAPPSDGRTTALVGLASFRDLRYHVYSETGRRLDLRLDAAAADWGSDYSYGKATLNYFDSSALGDVGTHHTLHWLVSAGNVAGGRGSRNEFGLGGSGRLRGYESDFVQGNRYYYGAVEYLRPIGWDWLRLFVTAEVGGADDDIEGVADGRPYASIGIGVRVRLTWFVDVEFEAGIARPLVDGEGARFFAGGN